jgi:hypothetical protein
MEGHVEEVEELIVRGVTVGLAWWLLGVLLLLLPLAITRLSVRRRRRFRCATARRKAEVEFEERGARAIASTRLSAVRGRLH